MRVVRGRVRGPTGVGGAAARATLQRTTPRPPTTTTGGRIEALRSLSSFFSDCKMTTLFNTPLQVLVYHLTCLDGGLNNFLLPCVCLLSSFCVVLVSLYLCTHMSPWDVFSFENVLIPVAIPGCAHRSRKGSISVARDLLSLRNRRLLRPPPRTSRRTTPLLGFCGGFFLQILALGGGAPFSSRLPCVPTLRRRCTHQATFSLLGL